MKNRKKTRLNNGNRAKKTGFSIIEVLIVLAIIVVLSALALPLTEITVVRARERILRDSLKDTRLAIDRYRRERNATYTIPFYPVSVASLLEPIPDKYLKTGGQPGPFLHKLPEHSFLGDGGIFLWDIRDASGAWNSSVNNASQQFIAGVFDIRVPVTRMNGWDTALDGTKYEYW